MAVFTPLKREELKEIIEQYPVGEMVGFEDVEAGTEDTIYAVDTTRARRVYVRLYEERTPIEDIPLVLAFQNHLADQNLPVAKVLSSKEGDLTIEFKGRIVSLFSGMPGSYSDEPSSKECHAVGAAIARMHLASDGLMLVRENSLSLKVLDEMQQVCVDAVDDDMHSYLHAIMQEMKWLKDEHPFDLPRAMVHADLCYDNVLLENIQVSGVIDFGFSCEETFMYDLALALNSYGFDGIGNFRPNRFHSMISGYESVRLLKNDERRAFNYEMRRSAMRIVTTRLYDSIFPPAGKKKINRKPEGWLRRLELHQQHLELADYAG